MGITKHDTLITAARLGRIYATNPLVFLNMEVDDFIMLCEATNIILKEEERAIKRARRRL